MYTKKWKKNYDYSTLLSYEEYKKYYQKELDNFNGSINKTRIIIVMIDRFIIRERYSDYAMDSLVCGTIDDYVWIMKIWFIWPYLIKEMFRIYIPYAACMTIVPKKEI